MSRALRVPPVREMSLEFKKKGNYIMTAKFIDMAKENTMKFFGRNIAFDFEEPTDPLVIKPLNEVLGIDGDNLLYVLTTASGVNGSLAWFYDETQERLKEMGLTDFYVLPSSIHELLIYPNKDMSEEELLKIVRDVNETEVDEKDILGYSILHCHDGISEVIGNED